MKVRRIRVIIAGAALLAAMLGSSYGSCHADTTLPKVEMHQITPTVKLDSAIQEEYDNWTPANRTQVLLDTSLVKNAPDSNTVIVKSHPRANIS